jgi:hypothetical protein
MRLALEGIPVLDATLDFESANPSVVKSIKQRDLLNTWLRLYAREQKIPDSGEYRPERLEDELPDLVYFDVDAGTEPLQIIIQSDGTRISTAMGTPARDARSTSISERGSRRLSCPPITSVYVARFRFTPSPTLTILRASRAYERLVMPFSDGGAVTHAIASLKTISEDGGFEIRNLMRGK